MKKSKLLKTFLLFIIVSSVLFSFSVNAVGITRVPCAVNSSDENCLPPTLGNFQTTIVSLIGTMYSMVGFIFLGILVFNGVIYLIGNLEDAKYILGASIEDVQKRMTQWLIGFMMVLISYPLVGGFMKTIVSGNECYSKLNNPMVQFIFPNVCPVIAKNTSSCESLGSATDYGDLFCNDKCVTNGLTSGLSSYSSSEKIVWCDCATYKCQAVITPTATPTP